MLHPGERLVIATHNDGKLREIHQLLLPWRIDAVSAGALGLAEPDETGTTFAANATIKAEAARDATGLPALADDSGLCVAALDGYPGVVSARWAKECGSFPAAMARIFDLLRTREAVAPFRAWFVSALALARPGTPTRLFEGRVDGVLVAPRGSAGFGYDPIFMPDGETRSFGEMTPDEKHGIPSDGSRALSHRARAFQAFAAAIVDQASATRH